MENVFDIYATLAPEKRSKGWVIIQQWSNVALESGKAAEREISMESKKRFIISALDGEDLNLMLAKILASN
ncbi:MAG: hypothetical protein V3S97_09620 [Candidatus Bathyarchaeia archaeon]